MTTRTSERNALIQEGIERLIESGFKIEAATDWLHARLGHLPEIKWSIYQRRYVRGLLTIGGSGYNQEINLRNFEAAVGAVTARAVAEAIRADRKQRREADLRNLDAAVGAVTAHAVAEAIRADRKQRREASLDSIPRVELAAALKESPDANPEFLVERSKMLRKFASKDRVSARVLHIDGESAEWAAKARGDIPCPHGADLIEREKLADVLGVPADTPKGEMLAHVGMLLESTHQDTR